MLAPIISSRMLAKSASCWISLSSLSALLKRFAGGICFGSPATINCLPRDIAPTASQTVICEASSKITTSNKSWFVGKYWAIERGDIIKQGANTLTTSGISFINCLTDLCCLCFWISRCKIPQLDVLPKLFWVGIPELSFAWIYFAVVFWNFSSSSLNLLIKEVCSAEEKHLNTSSSLKTALDHQSQ